MEVRSKKTFGHYLKAAITIVLAIGVVVLVPIAIWTNTTTCEKIFIFLVGIILFLLSYIFHLKEKNAKLKERILKLENYIRKGV